MAALERWLELAALRKCRRLIAKDRMQEHHPCFDAAGRQHSAIESAENSLIHLGLALVRTHGKEGFDQSVGLSAIVLRLDHILARQDKSPRRCAKPITRSVSYPVVWQRQPRSPWRKERALVYSVEATRLSCAEPGGPVKLGSFNSQPRLWPGVSSLGAVSTH